MLLAQQPHFEIHELEDDITYLIKEACYIRNSLRGHLYHTLKGPGDVAEDQVAGM